MEKYEEIIKTLEKNRIQISSSGFKIAGTKRNAYEEATWLLKAFGTTPDAVLSEYQKRLNSSAKSADDDGLANTIVDDMCYVTLHHRLLEEVDPFGDPDRNIFRKIRFARNPVDESIFILINKDASEWRAIPLSSNQNLDRMQLASACSKIKAMHEDLYPNYYMELMEATTKPLIQIIRKYKKKVLKTPLQMVNEILERVPHSMIRNSSIKMLCSVETRQIDGERRETVKVPETGAMYVSQDGAMKYDVFTHLISKASQLAAVPEMQTKFPKIISNKLNEPALKYIDLDKIVDDNMETPTWDEFAERFTVKDFEVIKAFIWSIFVANNRGRQLLYIYDPDGFSGKSVMLNVLSRYLGPNLAGALQKDSLNNQFSLAKVWDKRLITIDDNKNPNLIRSEKMHMMLGGGHAEIEMKGKNSFSARLSLKIIAAGNVPLEIDPYAIHENTRLIMIRPNVDDDILKRFCKVDDNGELVLKNGRPIMIGDPTFEDRMFDEMPGFLAKCRDAYADRCPTNANIELFNTQIDALYNLISDKDIVCEEIIEKYFNIGENESMAPFDFQKEFFRARSMVSSGGHRDEIADSLTLSDFKTFLSKRFKFFKISREKNPGEQRHRIIKGISPKREEPTFMRRYGV